MVAHPSRLQRGYTYIELAIVLVVIGLIVAGIVNSDGLTNSAKMRHVIKDLQTYQSAYNNFRGQYNVLPGDMGDATTYWNTTNNGSNDGVILDATACGGSRETLCAWQQLSLARFLEKSYTGAPVGGTRYVPDQNIPPAIDNSSGFIFEAWGGLPALLITAPRGATGFDGAALSVADARNIDEKLDDGNANLGNVQAAEGNGIGAGNCRAAGTGVYAADTTDTLNCRLALIIR